LTRNEWEMAQERTAHLFHLWDVRSEPPKLAKVSGGEMQRHVPADSGSGRWESVLILFAAFEPQFSSQ